MLLFFRLRLRPAIHQSLASRQLTFSGRMMATEGYSGDELTALAEGGGNVRIE